MASYQDRILRAMKLDVSLYEEVEADESALNQAMGVVVLSAIAGGIASIGHAGFGGILLKVVAGLLGWYIWAFLTYVIGTKLLPQPQTKSDYGEMLRTLGFASAPGLIQVASLVPGLWVIVFFVAHIWMLVAMVIAVRQALDYTSTLRAITVCVIGWLVLILVQGAIFSLTSKPAV